MGQLVPFLPLIQSDDQGQAPMGGGVAGLTDQGVPVGGLVMTQQDGLTGRKVGKIGAGIGPAPMVGHQDAAAGRIIEPCPSLR